MSRLAEGLSRFFGRVEILARGADEERRAAEQALARGHMLEARAHARALLARVPRSPLGLALWADAAEGCWLDDEVVEALGALVEQVPWRPEVWLRLGQAAARARAKGARSALERAGAADDPAIAREALLGLADLDIAAGEFARAQRWLDRVPQHPSQADPELALRRAECLLAAGDLDAARSWAERSAGVDDNRGRLRLVQARLAAHWPDEAFGGDAISMALSALLLEAPGAEETLAALVAASGDAALVSRVREAIDTLGRSDAPEWRAAFALAEGRREHARQALIEGAASGNAAAKRALAALAERWRDVQTLAELSALDPGALSPAQALLLEADHARRQDDDARALALLERAVAGDPTSWAAEQLGRVIASWVPSAEASRWDAVLGELRRAATALERPDLIAPIEGLAIERERPLYLAVLGEFNAGKSTLLNALLGTDVAPTGVRPTTATLHWVAWAPDPFARVVVRGGTDRVVPHGELKNTLEELHRGGARVERVFIYAPIERLKRVELLDTPGFNAPDTTHAEEARRGIEEAHVALWLLDATAVLKESERRVIEQVAAAGVPIQVLVNKSDRLAAAELAQVMRYVEGALSEVGIASLRPPVALSAQRALAGRLGDADALGASGWEAVEDLLSEYIVNRCDALRERALRRKARRVAGELLAAAGLRAHDLERERRRAELERHGLQQLAALLRRDRAALAEAMVAELSEASAQLAADVRPLAELSAERRRDPDIRSYLVERTDQRLTAPLLASIARRWPDEGPAPACVEEILAPAAGAALTGAAAVLRGSGPLAGEALMAAVEAALARGAEELARAAERRSGRSTGDELELRLRALAAALDSDEAPQAEPPNGGAERTGEPERE